MHGGKDKGFCFSYWKLSYRRKLIRTLWTFAAFLLIVSYLMISEPDSSRRSGYILGVVGFVVFVAQVFYTYHRWKAEIRTKEHN